MYVPEFICGMITMVLIEIILIIIAAVIYSGRKDKDQCEDQIEESEKE